MAFMARRVQLHSNLRGWLFYSAAVILFLCKCKEQQKTAAHFSEKKVNAANVNIVTKQGITYINDAAANALVFALYANGDTTFIRNFINGKEEGKSVYHYDNKQLKEIRNFANGVQIGEAKGWWPNGQQKFIYHFANDVYEGTVEEWNEKGLPYKKMNYKNGQEEGEQKLWYDNGVLRSNYVIKNGRRYGLLGTKNCVNVTDSIFYNK
jgi:antitoxin component YwqK of YwqJK toxin-antitoxin module